MTGRGNRQYERSGSKRDPIFSSDQPVAAAIAALVVVVFFLYFSWLALDRFIELMGAFSSAEIEAHFFFARSHSSWTEKSNWHDQPWKFIFSVAWVGAELIVLTLLSCGCISALANLTPKDSSGKRRN
ncbi:hypothetical protein [Luteimonas lutimaris]|uniref:hypothetical protein n=1 Tax=Luteimonas lutimaris TaxID=698645 RepID=UPI0031DE8125